MKEQSETSIQYRLLKPALEAYVLGLLTTTAPQVLSLLFSGIKGTLTIQEAFTKAYRIVRRQLAFEQFPTACAITLGGSTLLPRCFWWLWSSLFSRYWKSPSLLEKNKLDTLFKFLASFISALASFELLNRHKSKRLNFKQTSVLGEVPFAEEKPSVNYLPHSQRRRSSVALSTPYPMIHERPQGSIMLAGRTLDLTLFMVVRASDIVVRSIWTTFTSTRRGGETHPKRLRRIVENLAGSSMFALSSSLIMWSWFYSPDRLPRTYNTWIASAAQIDVRLVEALRQCRFGRFVYGKDTGLAPLLESMCHELNFPLIWGDPAKTIPIPCELYHSGAGPSCEWHALTRFMSGWRFAMRMYLPLNLLIMLHRKPSRKSTTQAFLEASQSSAFLGLFTALFYYGVCLARTRLGPRVFNSRTITPNMWDGGLCIGTGCMLCGWSIFLEKARRRQEIAFFVAPRALATIFPRRYDRKHLWREGLLFALSIAIILTKAQTKPWQVRGVFGRLLNQLYT